jgi:uncharacterized delta-60 repeat protein
MKPASGPGTKGALPSLGAMRAALLLVLAGSGAAALAFSTALAGASPAVNTAGQLDRAFGTGGKVVSDLGAHDVLTATAVQSDGRVVAGGLVQDPATGTMRWVVARYDRSGRLDPSFDGDGLVSMSFAPFGAEVAGIAIQRDGKIIAAGDSGAAGRSNDVTVARYNRDGSLDATFGSGGIARTDFGDGVTSGFDFGGPVVIGADGKITVAGATRLSAPAAVNWNFALARYNADGSPDLSFGSGGVVVTDFAQNESANGLSLAPDGEIVVVGITHQGNAVMGERFAIARYRADGSLDPSFDGDGMLVGEEGWPRDVVVQRDRKLVVAGQRNTPGGRTNGLFRYDAAGRLDPGFGPARTGFVPAFPNGYVLALVKDQRGRLLTGGGGRMGIDFGLARFSSEGKPDRSFGRGGKVETDLGGSDAITDVALAPDGKIVAAGDSNPGGSSDNWALARYLPTYCVVPNVRSGSLRVAKSKINRGHCSIGHVRTVASVTVKKKHVVAQKPRAGKRLAEGAHVDLVVSRGRPAKKR